MKTFTEIAQEVGQLLEDKNKQYGSAYLYHEAFLKILFPRGICVQEYKYVGLIISLFDILMRIAHGADRDIIDIAGYGILGVTLKEKSNPKNK